MSHSCSFDPQQRFPLITIDDAVLKTNLQAWQKHVQRPIWAVVKNDGYGWGVERMVSQLDTEVAGYCVADSHEFEHLRTLSKRPIILFSQPPIGAIASIARRGGHPTITSLDALLRVASAAEACHRALPVRLGLAPSIGWFGIPPDAIPQFVEAACSPWLKIELWSHLTTPTCEQEERQNFAAFVRAFRNGNVSIAAIDIESSAPCARRAIDGERARIGVGLFGAYQSSVPALQGAIAVVAPVLAIQASHSNLSIGYTRRQAPSSGQLVTLRIGYGDGLPRSLIGAKLAVGTVMNIGMQYSVIHRNEGSEGERDMQLLDRRSDLNGIARTVGISPHEIVLALGRRNRSHLE